MTLYTHFLSSLQHLSKFSSILYLFRGLVCQDLAFHATEAGPISEAKFEDLFQTRIKCLAMQHGFLKEAHIHMQQALGLPERLRFLLTLTLKMYCKKSCKARIFIYRILLWVCSKNGTGVCSHPLGSVRAECITSTSPEQHLPIQLWKVVELSYGMHSSLVFGNGVPDAHRPYTWTYSCPQIGHQM